MIELCEATEDNPFIHGMSRQFVKSLEQLFDVMDNEQIGMIRFVDLADQWDEDNVDPYFPKGLISCLAKVQLPNGLLTFDRFCAGIKLCLLKNQVDLKDLKLDDQQTATTSNNSLLDSPDRSSSQMATKTDSSIMVQQQEDRPSSEPQIFAPPPPPSALMPQTLSTNGHIHLNNNIYHNHSHHHHHHHQNNYNNSINIPANVTNIHHCPVNNVEDVTSTNTTNSSGPNTPKKLPLPSYEQVMASKTQPNNNTSPKSIARTPDDRTTSTAPNDQEELIIGTSPPVPPTKPTTTKPVHLLPKQFEGWRKVVSQFESHYGTTANSNKDFIKPQPSQPQLQPQTQTSNMIHSNACRAKSMSHLDYMFAPSDMNHSPASTTNNEITDICNNNRHNNNNNNDKPPPNEHPHEMNNQMDPIDNIKSAQICQNNKQQSSINITESSVPKTLSRNCIMKTLQNWRDNLLNRQQLIFNNPNQQQSCSMKGVNNNVNSSSSITEKRNFQIDEDQSAQWPYLDSNGDMASVITSSASFRRSSLRRREPRRHTVGANGIDLYAVRRFQQLEQEKDILIRGLTEIERTKEWYIRQISSIQDKINFAGRCGTFPSDCNIDAYQERINFQAIRIQTLNQHLISLREQGQTFPIHMNLAIRPLNGILRVDPNQPKQLVVNPNLVNKLKEQNRLLTDEVTRKSERITQLEREKSSLIRELFQARTYSSYYNGHFDDTFM